MTKPRYPTALPAAIAERVKAAIGEAAELILNLDAITDFYQRVITLERSVADRFLAGLELERIKKLTNAARSALRRASGFLGRPDRYWRLSATERNSNDPSDLLGRVIDADRRPQYRAEMSVISAALRERMIMHEPPLLPEKRWHPPRQKSNHE